MRHEILVVDDDPGMCELLAEGLGEFGHHVTWTVEPTQADNLLQSQAFDAVLTDIRMKGLNGLQLCRQISERQKDLPVLVMTAFGSLDTAIEAIRAGAYDFLTKPLDIEVAAVALDRAVQHRALRSEIAQLKQMVARAQGLGELIGSSEAMLHVYDLVERAAPSEASVLITGESGTGKELLATTLHQKSARSGGEFVSLNCAALPEPLLESELFGHVKGAFTDARSARDGLLVTASGGTLFLDEVAELPLGLQPKLLRALQERRIRPLGSDTERAVDIRIISATNRDLDKALETRSFREDLYYRLNVIHIPMPPLRDRAGDVLLLAHQFLNRFSARAQRPTLSLSEAAERRLAEYSWPGNVRELANSIERAVVLARGERIDVEDLPEKVREEPREPSSAAGRRSVELIPLAEIERRHIVAVLDAVDGNKSQAAQILGLDRKTLYRRLEQYGLLGD